MNADSKCATRTGCAQWVVLAAHERGRESRSRRDAWGERVFSTMAEEADRLFTRVCAKPGEEACK